MVCTEPAPPSPPPGGVLLGEGRFRQAGWVHSSPAWTAERGNPSRRRSSSTPSRSLGGRQSSMAPRNWGRALSKAVMDTPPSSARERYAPGLGNMPGKFHLVPSTGCGTIGAQTGQGTLGRPREKGGMAMQKWYQEEYTWTVEVIGYLRGNTPEGYCRNGEEIGDPGTPAPTAAR